MGWQTAGQDIHAESRGVPVLPEGSDSALQKGLGDSPCPNLLPAGSGTRPELRTGLVCPCQLLYVTLLVRRRSSSGVYAEGHGSRSTRGGTGSIARGSTQRSGSHFIAVQPGQGGDRARVHSLNTTQSKGHPGSQLVRMFL